MRSSLLGYVLPGLWVSVLRRVLILLCIFIFFRFLLIGIVWGMGRARSSTLARALEFIFGVPMLCRVFNDFSASWYGIEPSNFQ